MPKYICSVCNKIYDHKNDYARHKIIRILYKKKEVRFFVN